MDPRKIPKETWESYAVYTKAVKDSCLRWQFPFTEVPPMCIYVWWTLALPPDDRIEQMKTGIPKPITT